MTGRRSRRSARAILRDERERVLLIRFDIVRHGAPLTFWATPGGTIEDGEGDDAAARREIREELGLTPHLSGPVHTVTDGFEHEGMLVENEDIFFTGRCNADAPSLSGITEAETVAMREMRWWTIEEVEETNETIFPTDLGAVLRGLS